MFEIVDNNGLLEAVPLVAGTGNFTGLGLLGDTLYANTLSGELYAGTVDADPALVKIYDYVGAAMPNGMAIDNNGNLYTVDGPITGLPPAPQVLKLQFNPSDPFEVVEQTVWLNSSLQFSNGLTYNGEAFFITDSNGTGEAGSVRRIDINSDGSAGAVTTLYTGAGILDDLSVVGDKLLVSGFQNGDIILLDQNGNVEQQTTPATFSSASSVQAGEPPLFSRDDILVTEKGLLNDNDSNVGNVLSVFRAN